MTRAKWSMMIGAVVVASSVFAGAAFAATGAKSDPSAAHGVAEKQALMAQSEKFSVELSKAGLSSPEQLHAELDQRVADGLITREQADILFTKVSQDRGW